MPVVMSPVGTSDGSSRGSYGSAATAANGTADDRTAKRTLSKGFAGREHAYKREQNDQ
ncbi:hypothetical protein ABIB73_002578 [Bradyrhizobium sp. F1.4.3]